MDKKNKALIITQYDLLNYGNRFQNIALGFFLKRKFDIRPYALAPVIGKTIKSRLGYFKTQLQLSFMKRPFRKKIRSFKHFSRLIPGEFSTLLYPSSLSKRIINKKFDIVILGSDQVLSSKFGIPDWLASLDFGKGLTKIVYAASTGGFSNLQIKYPLFLTNAKSFDLISTREREDAVLLKGLLGKDIYVLPDPVFLLGKHEWADIIQGHVSKKALKLAKEPFVFVYWLGSDDSKAKLKIQDYAEKLGLKTVWARTANSFDQGGFIEMSPYDFIYLLQRAHTVVSKSFHGTALSILFEKNFIAYDQVFETSGKHDQRLLELSESYQIPLDRFEFFSEKFSEIDWSRVRQIMSSKRNQTINCFKTVFCKEGD